MPSFSTVLSAVAPGSFRNSAVEGLLRVHAELLGGRVPFRGGGLQRLHRVRARPNGSAHAGRADSIVVLRARHDQVEQADIRPRR